MTCRNFPPLTQREPVLSRNVSSARQQRSILLLDRGMFIQLRPKNDVDTWPQVRAGLASPPPTEQAVVRRTASLYLLSTSVLSFGAGQFSRETRIRRRC